MAYVDGVGFSSSRFRIGLRVEDVQAAQSFYEGLGFSHTATISNAVGRPVLSILDGHGVTVMADALDGLPFPDTTREREVQRGPRGLGVVAGLIVDELEATYRYFRQAGCHITSEPRNEPWGARVFSALDPFGFEWEIQQPIRGDQPLDAPAATQEAWFGVEPST